MKILITGCEGFIGTNLSLRLSELPKFELLKFSRKDSLLDLEKMINICDAIVHLAGSNRPISSEEFYSVNRNLTEKICDIILKLKRNIPIIYSSSTQVINKNDYGLSKLGGEEALEKLNIENGNSIQIYRLPNIFGKWSKPNYNSVIATFCNNLSQGLPIEIHDKSAKIQLLHVDNLIDEILLDLRTPIKGYSLKKNFDNTYTKTVGEISDLIKSFKETRKSNIIDQVGTGFERLLYSTYLSYLKPEDFSYELKKHTDKRGEFVEVLKTKKSGQFSFFTAYPGVTRGGHYHHLKNEKFIVLQGTAKFRFVSMNENKTHEYIVSSDNPEVVETIPGWAHDITNIGEDKLIVMLWANEIFDNENPDTFFHKL